MLDPPMGNTSRTRHTPDPERIYNLLLRAARLADMCNVHFKDGRVFSGALVFNPFKGTGRLINVDEEFSIDFEIDDVRDVRF